MAHLWSVSRLYSLLTDYKGSFISYKRGLQTSLEDRLERS
jgi:hypothetical protein